MDGTVILGRNVCKYFGGGNVFAASVVHDVQIRGVRSIDREDHVTAIFLKLGPLGKQQINFVRPGGTG